jgi:uncharacterized delta-60 repeat protein
MSRPSSILASGARRAALPVAISALMAIPPAAPAAVGGVPDQTFGSGGVASISASVPEARESGRAMVVDSQDRVLVGGGVLAKEPTEPNGGWVLARFLSDGSPDPTFGQGGVSKDAPGLFGPGLAEFGQEIGALAIEPGTGRIIAGGMTVNPAHRSLFTIARYNTDGRLDTSFGPADTGFVTAEFTSSGADLEDMAVGPDGSITAVGQSGLDAAVGRWDSDGNPDPAFDGPGGTGNGLFTDHIAGTFDDLRDVDVEPSGAVRAVGVASSASEALWLVVRYTPTGARDGEFHGDGAVTIGFGNGGDIGGGQVLDGNTLYVFGSLDTEPGAKTERDFAVTALDATTGTRIAGTTARLDLPGTQNLFAAGLQRVGGAGDPAAERFVMVGTGKTPVGEGGGALLAAMRRVGGSSSALEVDPEFGSGGLVLPPQQDGIWTDVATDSRNRILVGGELGVFETADLSAARYVGLATLGAADTTAPVITNARISPRAWAVKPRGRAEAPVASRAKRGTSFLYTLSEPARVTIRIERQKRKGKRAKRFVRAGAFAAAAIAGPNRRRFSGRIGKRRLKPGRYRATLIATDAAGNVSQPRRLRFRILPATGGRAGL